MQSIILTEIGKCHVQLKDERANIVHKPYHKKGEATLAEAVDVMMKLRKIVKDKGLLSLEEESKIISEDKFIAKCLNFLTSHVVDGKDEQYFTEIAMLYHMQNMFRGYEALTYLIVTVGYIYMIRNDLCMEETLLLMLPKDGDAASIYEQKAKIRQDDEMADFFEKGQAAFDRICKYKSPHKELATANRYIYESNQILQAMSDKTMLEFLREADTCLLSAAMTQYDGLTNKHIMSHMSSRLRVAMALEIEHFKGEADIDTAYVNDCCGKLMDVMSRLGII